MKNTKFDIIITIINIIVAIAGVCFAKSQFLRLEENLKNDVKNYHQLLNYLNLVDDSSKDNTTYNGFEK
ncbi:hypothetical protein [Companilactobacillus sp. DQM5]|uniref:hypothetical protein n=1 Tax=Companilactobacillus sp. DQM5 TaxID=3463359 RepID=UPI0040598067